MRVTGSTALIVAALLLTTVSTVAGFTLSRGGYLSPLAGPPLIGATGGINGTISIGNIYPLCSIVSDGAAPPYYNQIQAVITPSSGLPLTVPVNWVLVGGCWVHGTFKVGLSPGVYSVTLSSCISQPNSFGCSDLPRIVTVEASVWTQVVISIRTGIY